MWIKLDDNAIDNPKFYAAARHLGRHGHARAFTVYMAGLCYSNSHLTDGFVPVEVVSAFKCDRKPHEIALVLSFADVRLWKHETGSSGEGFRIHDYHLYNPKAQEIKDKRARDAERKRLERAAKEAARNGSRPDGQGADSAALARARSRPDPDPVPVPEKEHAALRASGCRKPVENRPTVLRALVWREVAAMFAGGPPMTRDPATGLERVDDFEIRERLKERAAAAGLLYGVDDFHDQAVLAIARFSAGAGARDRARASWRAR